MTATGISYLQAQMQEEALSNHYIPADELDRPRGPRTEAQSKEAGQKIVVSLPASIQQPSRAVRNLGLNFGGPSPAGNSNLPEASPYSSLQTRGNTAT